MLLTISTTHAPATDLGYLLHKHPARSQSSDLAFDTAQVFYPASGEDRCTAALLLDVDPIGLVRNRRGPAGEGFLLQTTEGPEASRGLTLNRHFAIMDGVQRPNRESRGVKQRLDRR